jgi:hypothetical protein
MKKKNKNRKGGKKLQQREVTGQIKTLRKVNL